jgi:Arc/MetJ-type ribon-helix-helix transcriptional regulator
MANDRYQANVRMSPEMVEQIDQRRIELAKDAGQIPTRSEVVRIAVEEYLARHGKRGKAAAAGKKPAAEESS